MNTTAETDIGPLTWVKGEIDLALARALDAFERQQAEGPEATHLKAARAHLHQAHGALSIVGLDGVTRFSEALEQLLEAVDDGRVALGPAVADATRQGIAAIRQYLDDLLAGHPDQPLRLLAAYRGLTAALGVAEPTPTELFFPDLSRRPPKREQEPAPLTEAEFKARAKTARMNFQRGLLKWLKHDPSGIGEMWSSVAAIEASQAQPAARAFWWAAMGLLDALAAGAVEPEVGIYRVCARIDLQMKKLIDGSRTVAERLMRDTLYYVAIAGPASDQAESVKAAYRLGDLLPAPAAAGMEPLRPTLRACREQLASAMEDWNRFCAGTAASLPQFHERVRQLAARTAQLGNADLSRLAELIRIATDELRKAPLSHTESLGLEMATALLLLANALESFPRVGEEFRDQIRAVGTRLEAARRGEALEAMEMPHLDEVSRKAQEKLLMAQVAKEILANLAIIEQTLDAFFRDPAKAGELAGLTKPLKQIEGALTVLGQERAVAVLGECGQAIAGFCAEGAELRQEDFEDVAHKLSALGFFAEKLQHGPAEIDSFLHPAALAVAEEEAPPPTAEREIEETKRATHELIEALREQPEDARLRDEIKRNLETLRESAELVDDAVLAEQAKAAIKLIKSEHPAAARLDEALAPLAAAEAPLIQPSPEAARLAEASHEEIDAELLGIFIEEAHEVLANIGSALPVLAERPHDRDFLTIVRRGFHTLKGSGRMVGLGDLGEAAWAVEQILNRWLQAEEEATPALQRMLGQAHELFDGWVAQLEAGGGLRRDASALVAACEQLRAEPAPAAPPLLMEEVAEEAMEEATEAPALEVPAAPAEAIELPIEAAEEAAPAPAAPILRLVQPAAEPDEVRIGDLALSRTLHDLYVTEAREHIATLQHELGTAGPPRPPLIRAAHTLGSISATAGIEPIHQLAHALEMALNRLDRAQAEPTETQRFLLARAAGALEGMFGAVVQKRMPQKEAALTADLDALTPVPTAAPETVAAAAREPEVAIPTIEAPLPPASTYPLAEAADTERRQMRLEDEIDPQLLPLFLEESTDQMRWISSGLRTWRAQPEDTAIPDQLKRVLHTLKGNARMAGAMAIGELVHGMETRVGQATSVGGPTGAFLDALDSSFDRVSLLIERLRGGEAARAEETIEISSAVATPAEAPIEVPAAPTIAKAPAVAPSPRPRVPEAEAAARTMLRVRADIVDKLVNEAGEIAIARGRIEGEMRSLKSSLLDLTENVIRLRNQLREIEIQAESQMQSRQALAAEQDAQFDPLEFDRFTRFQELTRMMAESVNDVATSQHTLLQNLDHAEGALAAQARLNREHSQALMNVRMVPFGTLADRLHRIVRQTAKELDKRANLDVRGGQTELDRSVLEKMTGPIEHLLRNAVAHGLEAPPKRRAAGKAEIGEIVLRVAQEGNEIAIELTDDGGGLDLERIRARGIEAGLLDVDAAATPEELTQFIFQPGFSTAERLTSIAGRGVGMDVVKTEVANLGGRIHVESMPGQGTRFHVYLPLTLAVTQAVLVKSGGRHHAIPASMVAQVRELKQDAVVAIRAEGSASWLGDTYPWHYLPRLLGNPDAQPEPARRHWVLLLKAGEQRIALEVDALVGNQEIVVKNIGPQLARVVGISGATVLADGEIALILNPIALAGRETRPGEADEALAPAVPVEAAAVAPPTAGSVMVVDDSLTVRKITGRLLAREGYHVLSAKDGVDALEQLVEFVPDVMLVDIEMPRMDGFELTRTIRADARLKNVPIIMITSRTAEKHRGHARELGVNHYVGKPYDEDELLKLIAGYTKKSS